MSTHHPCSAQPVAPAPMNVFERYLTVWVFLCIVVGIALGQLLPGPVPGRSAAWRSRRSTCRWAC